MIEIKHKQQPNDPINLMCGEACLEMVFDYFGIQYDRDTIWKRIQAPVPNAPFRKYALTYKVACCAIEHGLPATIYKGHDTSVLAAIDKLETPAILSITQKTTGKSHFVVYKGIKDQIHHICDPATKRDYSRVSQYDMAIAWRPNPGENVTGYIYIIFSLNIDETITCHHCNKPIPIVHSSLKQNSQAIICPHCDSGNFTSNA